jgi:hypothetical protein
VRLNSAQLIAHSGFNLLIKGQSVQQCWKTFLMKQQATSLFKKGEVLG